MRETVKCLNCGIIWVRVTAFGGSLEMNEDLMYNCPNCRSNAYESTPSPVHTEENDEGSKLAEAKREGMREVSNEVIKK